MMTQAGIIATRAISYAQFENYQKVSALTKQFTSVSNDAFECEKTSAPASDADQDAWRQAVADTKGKLETLKSLMKAVTE